MSDTDLKPETKAQLEQVSVATLATALFKRGLRNQVIQDVRPVKPKARNMVGPAFTCATSPHVKIATNWWFFAILNTHSAMQLKLALRDTFWLWTVGVIPQWPQQAIF